MTKAKKIRKPKKFKLKMLLNKITKENIHKEIATGSMIGIEYW